MYIYIYLHTRKSRIELPQTSKYMATLRPEPAAAAAAAAATAASQADVDRGFDASGGSAAEVEGL